MASNCFDDSLIFLKSLETDCDLEYHLKAQVRTLRLKASFLKAFLSCTGKWQIEGKNLKALLSHIEIVVQKADQDFETLCSNMIQISSVEDPRIPENFDVVLSTVLESFELVEPVMEEVYFIISKSSGPICLMTCEAVRELLDSVLQNMEDLLEADLIVPVQKEMEAVQKGLRFLRNFLGFTAGRCNRHEELKDLLAHVEIVVVSTVSLLYLFSINDKMGQNSVNEMKLEVCKQLQKIELNQPEVRKIYIKSLKASESFSQSTPVKEEFFSGFLDSLLENMKELLVSDTKFCFNFRCKDQILALQAELAWLRRYLIIPPTEDKNKKDWKVNELLGHSNALVSNAGCIIYSFYDDEIDEDAAKELNSAVFDLLSKAKVAKDDARKLYRRLVPQAIRSDFPRTNVQGFVNSHLQYLEELLISKADTVAPLKHDIQAIQKELSSLREDFRTITQQPSEHQQLEKQWARYNDVAHHTQWVIDESFVGGDNLLWINKLGLFEAVEEIKEIRIELKDIKSKMTDKSSMHRTSSFPTQVSLEVDSPENAVLRSKDTVAAENEKVPSKVVIFEDEAEKIKEQLTFGSTQLQILSIVGMPGVGKTTLAESIFEHPCVTLSFHVRARCCVTQVFRKRKMLLEILGQILSDTNKLDKTEDDDDLCVQLYRGLKGRKYLILMDDMWDIEPWKDMKYYFPDDNKGSRIIFTSRLINIAFQAETKSINYPLHPLSDDKSWDLLQVKTFGKENCPTGLMKLGQQIAKYCKGLPLTIDLIAGVLRLAERKEQNWQQITATLTRKLLDDPQGRCMNVLELSYQHLPDHLKQCFLYFGAFAEDTLIPAKKLIQLWIAERFVQLHEDDQKSLEDVAESYLNDLISRSLITVSERRSLGEVKESSVHDLLHDFALGKAKEENLLEQIDGSAERLLKQHRLCIYGSWKQFAKSYPYGPRVRSIIFSGSVSWDESVSFIAKNFKLLTVLDLGGIQILDCPAIFSLIHLRFLALESYKGEILSRISNLQNLETFLLNGSAYDRSLSLENFGNMVSLRHFHFEAPYYFHYQSVEFIEKSFLLYNLRSLSSPYLSYGKATEVIMEKLPNLQKLSCTFLDSWDDDAECNRFPELQCLDKLESLKVNYDSSRMLRPCQFNFPQNLKKLVLIGFGLPWSEFSAIGKLENLEVLKLRFWCFMGQVWKMEELQFPKLKVLNLTQLFIEEWIASEDLFPQLEKLEVQSCHYLNELPSFLANVQTLQVIELHACRTSLVASAQDIKTEQVDMGNDQFEVIATDIFDRIR